MKTDIGRTPLGCPTCETLPEDLDDPGRGCSARALACTLPQGVWAFGGVIAVVTRVARDSLWRNPKLHSRLYSTRIDLNGSVYPYWVVGGRHLHTQKAPNSGEVDLGSRITRIAEAAETVGLMLCATGDFLSQDGQLTIAIRTTGRVFSLTGAVHTPGPTTAIATSLLGPRLLRTESLGRIGTLVRVLGIWLPISASTGMATAQQALAHKLQTLMSLLILLGVLSQRILDSERISTGFLIVSVRKATP